MSQGNDLEASAPVPSYALLRATPASLKRSRFASVTRRLKSLASLKLTLACLGLLTAAVLLAYGGLVAPTTALALPFVLLTINLLAAIASNAKFQRQTTLMVFHLALLLVVWLFVAGRLTYLDGKVELTVDSSFDGQLMQADQGPWHNGSLANVRFRNNGFSIDFAKDGRRQDTFNKVSWVDRNGETHHEVIGDDHPLILSGYRFYTSTNMGYAPMFAWYPADNSMPVAGAVHLKPYMAFSFEQAQEWNVPGTEQSVWVMLDFDEKILKRDQASKFRVPEQHQIIIRYGNNQAQRQVLAIGDSIQLPEGRLSYGGLKMWMGYQVRYDWTLPWLAAAGFLASLSLLGFYGQKFNRGSWLTTGDQNIQNTQNLSN